MEKWAERIQARMKERGIGEGELARLIGVKQPSVFQWFKPVGDKPTTKTLRADNLLAVARHLQLSPEWILSGHGPRELSQYVGLSTTRLEVAIVSVRKALEQQGMVVDEVRVAAIIAWAYRELGVYPDPMTKPQMRDFDVIVSHKLLTGGRDIEEAERSAVRASSGAVQEPAPARKKAGRSR